MTLESDNIYQRLTDVHQALGTIEKRPVQNFKAFAIDDVYANLGPLFAKFGVVVVPQVVNTRYEPIVAKSGTAGIAAYITVAYTFYAPDGSHVEMVSAAEGQDYSDKATNKAVQQAFKYGLIQMFQISTGEVDPDATVVDERVERTPAEERMHAVNSAAWKLVYTDGGAKNATAAKALVTRTLGVYGGEPKNGNEVAAVVDMMTADKDNEV